MKADRHLLNLGKLGNQDSCIYTVLCLMKNPQSDPIFTEPSQSDECLVWQNQPGCSFEVNKKVEIRVSEVMVVHTWISVPMLLSYPYSAILCICELLFLTCLYDSGSNSSSRVILLMKRKKAKDRSDKTRQMETQETVYKNLGSFFSETLGPGSNINFLLYCIYYFSGSTWK